MTTHTKLRKKHKDYIVQRLAAFDAAVDIVEGLQSEFSVSVTRQNVQFYKKKRKNEIEVVRERLRADVMTNHPLANRFKRIGELEELYKDLKENIWIEKYLMRSGKIQVDENGKPKVMKLEGQHDVMRKILETIAREVEPLRIEINARDVVEKEVDRMPEDELMSAAYKILADSAGLDEDEKMELSGE